MRVKLLRERALTDLKANVSDNLERYRNGNFFYLALDPSLGFDSDIELDENAVDELKQPVNGEYFEPTNCAVMLRALKSLTSFQAADERLWAMLSHTTLLPHARVRWPIPKDDESAPSHILKHFFASTQRQLERDNVGGRLWWMGHLCSRIKSMPLEDSLNMLLFRSDVRANIVERPTTSQSISIFTALINKLAASYRGKKKLFERQIFRKLMIGLNGLGGYRLLDALDSKAVEKIIDEIVSRDLKVSAV